MGTRIRQWSLGVTLTLTRGEIHQLTRDIVMVEEDVTIDYKIVIKGEEAQVTAEKLEKLLDNVTVKDGKREVKDNLQVKETVNSRKLKIEEKIRCFEKMVLSKRVAAVVMGRRGRVSPVERWSGTKVKVREVEGDLRELLIMGSEEEVRKAQEFIGEVTEEQEQDKEQDEHLSITESDYKLLLRPRWGGDTRTVSSIEEATHTSIGVQGLSGDWRRNLLIKGTGDAREMAKDMIRGVLQEHKAARCKNIASNLGGVGSSKVRSKSSRGRSMGVSMMEKKTVQRSKTIGRTVSGGGVSPLMHLKKAGDTCSESKSKRDPERRENKREPRRSRSSSSSTRSRSSSDKKEKKRKMERKYKSSKAKKHVKEESEGNVLSQDRRLLHTVMSERQGYEKKAKVKVKTGGR